MNELEVSTLLYTVNDAVTLLSTSMDKQLNRLGNMVSSSPAIFGDLASSNSFLLTALVIRAHRQLMAIPVYIKSKVDLSGRLLKIIKPPVCFPLGFASVAHYFCTESRMRKQRGCEWDARVRIFTKLAFRISCDPGWATSETVLLLANKRAFAKKIGDETNAMLAEERSKQVYMAERNDVIVSALLVIPFQPFIEFANSLISKN